MKHLTCEIERCEELPGVAGAGLAEGHCCGESVRDRRRRRRYPLRLRAKAWPPRDCSFIAKARTRDLSSGGVYFVVEGAPSPGMGRGEWLEVEVNLMLDPSQPFEVVLRGVGQVVRTEATGLKGAPLGVAIEFERHELIRRPWEEHARPEPGGM